ncbi:docking protein 2-like isoform X2 [Babylonia areolata]|uniref:docking protein 2-like isoform X2 n=1 Tax=Babylonia areolata TaxID=304850 RepID=UPI003FD30F62
MAMVISGYLTIKQCGLLKSKYLPGNWGVLYDSSSKRPPRIDLFADADATTPLHTLHLEHLKFPDKSHLHRDITFNLSIKKEKHQFQLVNVGDKFDWVQSLCHVSTDLWSQRASVADVEDSNKASAEVMQENILYDSVSNGQQFKVSVIRTTASDANKLQGNYMLTPTQESIRLLDVVNYSTLHEWPYTQIRSYGPTRRNFKMVVGRKCSTGEGEFKFFTPNTSALVDLITTYMEQAKETQAKQSKGNVGLVDPPVAEYNTHSVSSLQSNELQHFPATVPNLYTEEKHFLPKPAPRSKMNTSPTPSQEREAKEHKEREKKQKHVKGAAVPESNIYDEPEDVQRSAPPCQPGHGHLMKPGSGALPVYSTPEKPQKDGWKKHSRPERDQVHREDYNGIKSACTSLPPQGASSASPYLQNSSPQDVTDEYSSLREINTQAPTAGPEHIYGMASAKDTVSLVPPSNRSAFAGGNEYEDADAVSSGSFQNRPR